MDEGWFVPGGAVIAEGVGKLRLRPPEDWHREILEIPRVPPSMNENRIRSHWRGFQREKKSWQDEIALLLMASKAPRANQRAIAGVFMRFPLASKRRDPSNYRGLVDKALGDALVVSAQTPLDRRWIPDDDGPHYFFGGVEFEPEPGPPRTTIHLFLQPKED